MSHNLRKHRNLMKNSKDYGEFMDDVYNLHMCKTEEKYNADLDSFFEKYNGCAMLEYF